jgi:hypothetical protein
MCNFAKLNEGLGSTTNEDPPRSLCESIGCGPLHFRDQILIAICEGNPQIPQITRSCFCIKQLWASPSFIVTRTGAYPLNYRDYTHRFAEVGSVHLVWLPLRSQELLIARMTAALSNVTVVAHKDKNHE